MLKYNTYSKIVDVNEYLKIPYERFHSYEGCSKCQVICDWNIGYKKVSGVKKYSVPIRKGHQIKL